MYSVHVQEQLVVLKHSTHLAEIYLHGALLNRFEIQGKNVVAAFASPNDARENLINGFRSAKLSPYACRLHRGQYDFLGKSYTCRKHQLGGHAIHGLMYDVDYHVEAFDFNEEKAWVVLQADYQRDDEGFPFDYQLRIKYTLENNGLEIETQVLNTGNSALPLVDGWHPYFTLGGRVDDWFLHINARQQLEFNEDLLPTGKVLDDTRFVQAKSLQNIDLDNSFVLENHDVAACVLSSQNHQLSIFPNQSYPYLQVYIPPERTSIALENLSGAPDAFNNGLGLLILESGENHVFTTRYVLENRN